MISLAVAAICILFAVAIDFSWRQFEQTKPDGAPIVLFDGVCGLCNFYVDFIIKYAPLSDDDDKQIKMR